MDSSAITQLNAVVKAQGWHALLRQMGCHNFDKSLKRKNKNHNLNCKNFEKPHNGPHII